MIDPLFTLFGICEQKNGDFVKKKTSGFLWVYIFYLPSQFEKYLLFNNADFTFTVAKFSKFHTTNFFFSNCKMIFKMKIKFVVDTILAGTLI